MTVQEGVDFTAYAMKYDNHRIADPDIVDVIIDNCKIDESMQILDFGCGTGNYLQLLQLKGYSNLFGLDQSDDMCKSAYDKTAAIIRRGSHKYIPFHDNFFDAIIIIDVMHFIDDLSILFHSLKRVSKRSGFVFISTQSHKQLDARIYGKYFPSAAAIDKLRHHEIDEIVRVAEENGFSLCKIQDYLTNADFIVDKKYFDLIQDKAFYILRLLSDKEFNNGIEMLKADMKNGNFTAKFAGRTLITLQARE